MSTDNIVEIGIDDLARLCIKPQIKNFNMIWRSAMEVHWDEKGEFLYSPKPREWNYLQWYIQIIAAARDEYGCILHLTENTRWVNIPNNIKEEISDWTDQNIDK